MERGQLFLRKQENGGEVSAGLQYAVQKTSSRFQKHKEIIHRVATTYLHILSMIYRETMFEIKIDRFDVSAIDLKAYLRISLAVVLQHMLQSCRAYTTAMPIYLDIKFMQKEMPRTLFTHRVIPRRLSISIYQCIVLTALHLLADAFLRIHHLQHIPDLLIRNDIRVVFPPDPLGQGADLRDVGRCRFFKENIHFTN